MGDSVLHERLQDQRGQLDRFRSFLNVFLHSQACAEPHFFDGKVAMQQREFLGKRNAVFLAESQRHAEEFREKEDRKSTRLNSSHMSISYAVFCLKKKK